MWCSGRRSWIRSNKVMVMVYVGFVLVMCIFVVVCWIFFGVWVKIC